MATILFGVIFGLLVGYYASKRGYSFWAYFLGSPIVNIITLLLLPDLRESKLEGEEKRAVVVKGNNIGWIITALTFFANMYMLALGSNS